jgi:hypothetical protein
MTELGLISSENNLEFSFPPTKTDKSTNVIEYGNKGIVLYRDENSPKQAIKVLVFTKTGIELSKLIESKSNSNYITKICSSFTNPKVQIEYGDLLKIGGRFRLLNKSEFNK